MYVSRADCGDIDENYGVIISANDSVFTIQCDDGHVPAMYTAECLKNGSWLRDEYCVPYGKIMFVYTVFVS